MSITKPTNTFLGIEVQEPNDVITASSGSVKDSTYASAGSTVVKYSYRNTTPFPTDTSDTYIEEKLSKRFVSNENFDINRYCVDYQTSFSGRHFEKVNNLYFIYNTEGLSVSKDTINWKFVNFNNITPVEKSRTTSTSPEVNKVTYDSIRKLYYATMWNKVFVSEDGFNWGIISTTFYNNNLGSVEAMPDGRVVVAIRGSTNFYRFESTDNMVNWVAKSSSGNSATNTIIAGKQGDFLYGVDFSTKGLYKIDLVNNTHTLLESFGNTSGVSCAEVGNQLIFIAGTPSTTDIVIVENGIATKVTSAANTGIQVKPLPYMRGNVAKLGNTYYFTPTNYSATVTGMIKTTDFVTFSSEIVTPNKFVTGGDFLCQFVMSSNGITSLFNDDDKLIVFSGNITLLAKPLVGPDFYPMYATADGKEWFGYGDINSGVKRSTTPLQRNTVGALYPSITTATPLTVIRNNSAFVIQGGNTYQFGTIGMTDVGVQKASLSGLNVSLPPMQYHDFGTGMEAVVGRNARVYYTNDGFTTVVSLSSPFSFTASRPFLVNDGKLISCLQGSSTNYLVAFNNSGPTYGRWPSASTFPVLSSGNTPFYFDTLFDSVSNKYVISALARDPVDSSVWYSPVFLTSTDAENWIAIENASGLPASVSVIRLATMNGNFFLKVYDYNLKEYSTFKSSDLLSWTKIITPFENYQVLHVFTAGSYFFAVTIEGIYYSSSSFDDFKIVNGTAPVFDSQTGSFVFVNFNTTNPQYHVQGTTVYCNTRVGMSYIDATKPEEGLKTISGEGYPSRTYGSNIIRTCKSSPGSVFKLCQGRVLVSRDGCETWSILFDAANVATCLLNTDNKLLAYPSSTAGTAMYKICPKSGAYTKHSISGGFAYGTPFGSPDTEGFANIGDTIVTTTSATPLIIFTSGDGGVTWTTINPADATGVNPASLFVFEGAFYIGYNTGNTRVARSTDGINWTTIDLGPQDCYIRKLHRSSFDNKMYALACRYSDSLPVWVEVGDDLSTQPTYFTTLSFGIPSEYFVYPTTGENDSYTYNTLRSLNLNFIKYDGTYEYFYNPLGDIIRVDSTYSIDKWRVIYRSEVNTIYVEYRAMTLLDDGTLVRSFPQSTPYFWSNAKIVTPKTSQNMRTYDGPTTSYYYIGS